MTRVTHVVKTATKEEKRHHHQLFSGTLSAVSSTPPHTYAITLPATPFRSIHINHTQSLLPGAKKGARAHVCQSSRVFSGTENAPAVCARIHADPTPSLQRCRDPPQLVVIVQCIVYSLSKVLKENQKIKGASPQYYERRDSSSSVELDYKVFHAMMYCYWSG